jgi:hypothetical protein
LRSFGDQPVGSRRRMHLRPLRPVLASSQHHRPTIRCSPEMKLPTRHQHAPFRITPCAARRSHLYRAKFIPKLFSDSEQSLRRFQQWRWVCSTQEWKVT